MLVFTMPVPTMAADAKPIAGDWEGTLDPGAQAKKRIVVHISAAQDGNLSGTIDYPDQETSGTLITATGTTVPSLDPALYGFVQVGRNTNPQTSSFVSGTNDLLTKSTISTFGYTQSFLTGTNIQAGLSNSTINTNSLRTDLNPSTSSTLGINVTQPLLQGFGPAVNSRYIQIARNNREASDLVFKEQVINIIASVINLYWDLVSFNEAVKVQQQAVDLNNKLLGDNRKQVEIGTLAPISIVSAEAELATAQQALTLA